MFRKNNSPNNELHYCKTSNDICKCNLQVKVLANAFPQYLVFFVHETCLQTNLWIKDLFEKYVFTFYINIKVIFRLAELSLNVDSIIYNQQQHNNECKISNN